MNLTFEDEPRRKRNSNVKFAPPGDFINADASDKPLCPIPEHSKYLANCFLIRSL
jgi:hypothetical protein